MAAPAAAPRRETTPRHDPARRARGRASSVARTWRALRIVRRGKRRGNRLHHRAGHVGAVARSRSRLARRGAHQSGRDAGSQRMLLGDSLRLIRPLSKCPFSTPAAHWPSTGAAIGPRRSLQAVAETVRGRRGMASQHADRLPVREPAGRGLAAHRLERARRGCVRGLAGRKRALPEVCTPARLVVIRVAQGLAGQVAGADGWSDGRRGGADEFSGRVGQSRHRGLSVTVEHA